MKSCAHRRDTFLSLHFFSEARETIALCENQALKTVARDNGRTGKNSSLDRRNGLTQADGANIHN